MVIVDSDRGGKSQRRKKKRSKKKTGTGDGDSTSSPRDSTSNLDSPSGAGTEALKKLDDISADFRNNWEPLCAKFISAPPSDEKKRDEEYCKLSESVLQHVLLKLDGVETDGIAEIRARRKALVKEVQEVLKALDLAKAGH